MSNLKSGNLRELWKVSYPMMVMFLSMSLMIFVDRLFLSWYSTEALNAAVQAGTLSWAMIVGWLTMASMSEVFVAQYNGSNQREKIGRPVWQMIWLCMISFIFFIPMAIWGSPIIYNVKTAPLSLDFFRYLMFFGPMFALVPGIGGFFVGRGSTQVMQYMAILGNLINIILDPIFIFGIPGIIPQMGVIGAAIATGIGTTVQAIILFFIFMRKENQKTYHTNDIILRPSLLLKSITVGLPPSVFIALELIGWAVFYHLMAEISEVHIFVSGVCQTIFILFMFFGMGLEKGAIAVVGNLIGAGAHEQVQYVFKSGIRLITYFTLLIATFLIVFPNPLINWFFIHPAGEIPQISFTGDDLIQVKSLIRIGMIFILGQMFFEYCRWLLNGILTAAGDTLFLLFSGVISVWSFLILPTYFFVVLPKAPLIYAFSIWVVYSSLSVVIMYARYRTGKWKKKNLIKEDISVNELSK